MYIVIFLTMVFQSSAGWTDKKDFFKKNFSPGKWWCGLHLLMREFFGNADIDITFIFNRLKGQVCDGKEQTASRSEKTAFCTGTTLTQKL